MRKIDYEVIIPGWLPTENDYIKENRANPYKGAKFKRKYQNLCICFIKSQLRNVKITRPVQLNYTWFEKNKRRDLDNIAGFGHKIIQDALVEAGVLQNDGWNEIYHFTDTFLVDKKNPRIRLVIHEKE